ncbi:hypothetical protein IJ579_06785 [bacterium]|nr:hypothetical protein [bacterium]
MGLAASQARFLGITARKASCEFKSTELAEEKLELSNQLTDISAEYFNALNATKLVWQSDIADSDYGISYGLLMTPSALNDYNPYMVTTKSGAIVLSSEYVAAAEAAGISMSGGLPSEQGRDKFINALIDSGVVTQETAGKITKYDYDAETKTTKVEADEEYIKWNPTTGVGGELIDKTSIDGMDLGDLKASESMGQKNIDWVEFYATSLNIAAANYKTEINAYDSQIAVAGTNDDIRRSLQVKKNAYMNIYGNIDPNSLDDEEKVNLISIREYNTKLEEYDEQIAIYSDPEKVAALEEEYNEQLKGLDKNIRLFYGLIIECNDAINSYNDQITNYDTDLEAYDNQLAIYDQQIQDYDTRIENQNNLIKTWEEQGVTGGPIIDGLRQALEQLQSERAALQAERDELQKQRDYTQSLRDGISAQKNYTETYKANIEHLRNADNSQKQKLETELKDLPYKKDMLVNEKDNFIKLYTNITTNGFSSIFDTTDSSKIINGRWNMYIDDGKITKKSDFDDMKIADLIDSNIVLVYANYGQDEDGNFIATSTRDFSGMVLNIMNAIFKAFGYGDTTHTTGLNYDEISGEAIDFAYSMIKNNILKYSNAVKNGKDTSDTKLAENSAYQNAMNNNRIGADQEGKYVAVNLSNVLDSFLTYYDNYLMNSLGESSNFNVAKTVDMSSYVTENSSYLYLGQASDEVVQPEEKIADFYDQLYNNLCVHGWRQDDTISNPDSLESAIIDGRYNLSALYDDGYYYQTNYVELDYLVEVADEDAIARAEADFARKKAEITYKENAIDIKSKNLDAEIAALNSELSSVQNLITNGIQKTFQMFQ